MSKVGLRRTRSRWFVAILLLSGLLALLAGDWPGARPALAQQQNGRYLPLLRLPAPNPQPDTIAFWGMNLYLTKRERRPAQDNLPLLADLAREAGVEWSREELPWDLIEQQNDTFLTIYDEDLLLAARKGFSIIGMLLTTPAWARDPACRASFWCPPADVNEYAEFAAWMVERYDGDGFNDAPGSPRIAAWQIWNEPNDPALWPELDGEANRHKRRYGELLVAAYAAIKAADPTATVLSGGVYIFDGSCTGGICDGLNFFNAGGGVFQQVPAARQAFDVFAIHPYIPTARPDDPAIPGLITLEGRLITVRRWLDDSAIGRGDAPIWISEVGWCTAPGVCPGGVAISEDEQASYLVRALVIAQQLGVEHASWFQFEDAFNNPNREWSNAAIVRQYDGVTYPAKPAYSAYKTLATRLAAATPAGTGPLHSHQYDPNNPYVGVGGTYHYRYISGSATIDILWRPADTITLDLPVRSGAVVTRVALNGDTNTLIPVGGVVTLEIGEQPLMIIQQ